MIIEKLEQTLETAKKYQIEATILLMQKEQHLRTTTLNYIEEGLNLLGKGVVLGRKLSESFTAQTHRRAEKLKKTEQAFDRGMWGHDVNADTEDTGPEPMLEAESFLSPQPPSDVIPAKQLKKMNRKSAAKKTKLRDRRIRAHSSGTARAR